jgi:hypothetical protein
MEREVFVLGGTRGPIKQWPLVDFFDGLETVALDRVALPVGTRA